MRRPFASAGVAVGLTVMLVACEAPDDAAIEERPRQPIVVFAAYPDAIELDRLFADFTDATGITVIVRSGTVDSVVDDVMQKRVSPAADLLLTESVTGVWRAADEGALRPFNSRLVSDTVADWARDPDGFWFARSYRSAVIVFDPGVFVAADFSDYTVLAEPRFRSQLCLTTFGRSINQTVVARLIDEFGVRSAEIIVRGWLRNLAAPAFDSEQELLDAIAAGICSVGIASSTAVAVATTSALFDMGVVTPLTAYIDIDGVGIARHANNPQGALAVAEWLLSPSVQTLQARTMLAYPVNTLAPVPAALDVPGQSSAVPKNVSRVAWQVSEAIRLAERAQYR